MITASDPTTCGHCGYPNATEDAACSMCGALLRTPAAQPVPAPESRVDSDAEPRRRHSPDLDRTPLVALGAGLLLAPVFGLTPILRYMAWFLGSLTHEMGHSAAAWFCGCPAFPAIRLDGHAAALHQPQLLAVAGVVWAGLAGSGWHLFRAGRRRRGLALGTVALLYPAIAFTDFKELLFLLSGHGGELAFAAVFFWRALAGGFSHSLAERITHAAVAWLLVGVNLRLSWRLMTSAAGREAYRESGSFGLTNDYLRVAEDVVGCRLESIAAGMGLLALAVPLVVGALWFGRRLLFSRA